MSIDTMKRCAELPRVIGVKDATADLARPARTKLAIGADFCQLSGEDATALPFLAQGGVGCISVTSNVAPKLTAQMHAAWRAGDLRQAMEINERLMPVNDAMFCETSPGPVKYALSIMGHIQPDLRLPLAPISDASKQKVEAALKKAGLIGQ
jgi:4-hydroxy-tetrahydrodipicolinate synthase